MPVVSRPELTLTPDPSGVIRVKVVYDIVWFWIDGQMDF
jgi:hypothetical protein